MDHVSYLRKVGYLAVVVAFLPRAPSHQPLLAHWAKLAHETLDIVQHCGVSISERKSIRQGGTNLESSEIRGPFSN